MKLVLLLLVVTMVLLLPAPEVLPLELAQDQVDLDHPTVRDLDVLVDQPQMVLTLEQD